MPGVRVEPPGTTRAARRPTLASLKRLAPGTPELALATAAAALIAAGRADFWVLAVLLGLSDRSVVPTLVAAAAGAVTLDRFGSLSLGDLAGAQTVLGEAGWHGSGPDIAASWLLAFALLLACRRPLPSALAGALGALVVAGPAFSGGPGDVAVRLGALSLGALLGWYLAPRSARTPQMVAAVLLALIALLVSFGVSV